MTSDGSYFCLCQGLGVFFGSGVGDGWRDAACGSAPPGRNDGSAPHKADEVMRAAALAAAGVRGERCRAALPRPDPRLAPSGPCGAIASSLPSPSIVFDLASGLSRRAH